MPTATISHPPEGLAPPLLSMPVEVLCAIFVLLDPISLIAAAQTSRALRDPANEARTRSTTRRRRQGPASPREGCLPSVQHRSRLPTQRSVPAKFRFRFRLRPRRQVGRRAREGAVRNRATQARLQPLPAPARRLEPPGPCPRPSGRAHRQEKSRRVSRHHVLERHFPGLLDFLHERSPDPALAPPATYPRGFRYFNIDRRYETWTLYTAYCGSCTQWHELAGSGYYAWSPREMPTVPLADPKHPSIPLLSLCHQCSQREDPSGFSQRLARAAIQSANAALKAVDFRLAWGWNSLYKHFTDQELKSVGRPGTPILHGLPWKGRTDKQMYPTLDLGEDMIPELRVHLERLR